MKKTNILGIDLAKNIFHLCKMNNSGRVIKRLKATRGNLLQTVINHCDGVVAIEACGGANYWARQFESLGLEVRQMPAQFVKPFVKSNKNDKIDAEAICEAASRPQMRFVTTKTEQQQDIQSLHRIRERLVKQRTALSNEIRGLLLEYGIAIPKGVSQIRRNLHKIIEENAINHSVLWKATFLNLYEEFVSTDKQIAHYEKMLKTEAQTNETCKRLEEVPGVGMITATAIISSVTNAKDFKNGRQFAAYLGLTPRQNSTGGKARLGGISKRGDGYIRKLLVQGAMSVAIAIERKRTHKDESKRGLNKTQEWFFELTKRRGSKKAVIALANKTARQIWKVLSGENFKTQEELEYVAA